nr:putative ATPase family protein [Oceanusvirus sp.]
MLLGVGAAAERLASVFETYDGSDLRMVLVVGPPGSGRSTLVRTSLKAKGFDFHLATSSESTNREIAKALSFCSTKGTVDSLLSGKNPVEARARRAVLLDDNLPDVKSISTAFDAIKAAGCKVLVVACVTRTTKTVAATRRASVIVTVDYPKSPELVKWLREKNPELSEEAARRCVRSAGRCVPKALSMVESEKTGTKSTTPIKLIDCTIFDEVAKAVKVADGKKSTFSNVEIAVSSEPSLCALILRDAFSARGASKHVTDTFRWFSQTPPGDYFGPVAAAVVFRGMLLKHADRNHVYRFPKCYTITSSRTMEGRKHALIADPWFDQKRLASHAARS